MKHKSLRLIKIAKEYNISVPTLVSFLKSKGYKIDNDPMVKISYEIYQLLQGQFEDDRVAKQDAEKASLQKKQRTKYIIFEGEKIVIDKSEPVKIITKKKNASNPQPPKAIVSNEKVEKKKRSRILRSNTDGNRESKESTTTDYEHKNLRQPEKEIENRIKPQDGISSQSQSDVRIMKHEGLRLSKIAKEFKINLKTIVNFLESKGIHIQNNPMARIPYDVYQLLQKEFDIGNERSKQGISNVKQKSDIFFIPFNELKFQNGRVVFRKWLWQSSETVEIFIRNSHVREEFDSVKNFFQKALDIKDIKVELNIGYSRLSVKSLEAYSPDIAKIDTDLIDAVRVSQIIKISKSKLLYGNSYIIGAINELPEETKSVLNIFYKQDNELLSDILTIQNTKHRSHLEYLAFKQSKIEKLRFLFKPFSFIFLLEGENKLYIIWETLDTSEATYIWPVEKNKNTLLSEFNKLEATIQSIKQGGKMAYIGSTTHKFRRIYHDYAEITNGFPKWRLELEAIIQ